MTTSFTYAKIAIVIFSLFSNGLLAQYCRDADVNNRQTKGPIATDLASIKRSIIGNIDRQYVTGNLEGSIVIKLTTDCMGKYQNHEVIETFDNNAIRNIGAVIKNIEFKPAKLNGTGYSSTSLFVLGFSKNKSFEGIVKWNSVSPLQLANSIDLCRVNSLDYTSPRIAGTSQQKYMSKFNDINNNYRTNKRSTFNVVLRVHISTTGVVDAVITLNSNSSNLNREYTNLLHMTKFQPAKYKNQSISCWIKVTNGRIDP